MATTTGNPSITGVTITPVAMRDRPLLNVVGVHQPYALRAIVEVETDAGITGLGETYADAGHLARLELAARSLIGHDVFALHRLRATVAAVLDGAAGSDRHGLTGGITPVGTIDRVFSPFEVACLDVQGRALGRSVSDLLGGAVRDEVPFSAYLFYKWAGHPGADDDEWGAALDTEGIVAQAQRMVDHYGFSALKLKGGVLAPRDEVEAIRALRERFPDHPLRIDPNAGWSPATSITVGGELAGVLEYLEDPTRGMINMAQVAAAVPMPLATNMCVVDFDQLPEGIATKAVGIILSDHHYWGGLNRSRLLAGICDTFHIGLSMHSNSHLGISLAAMTHLGAASPEITYACDTHWPWKDPSDDVIVGGVLAFKDGAVRVPTTPGLGVELDRDALARMHEQYVTSGLTSRDDSGYMRSIDPSYAGRSLDW